MKQLNCTNDECVFTMPVDDMSKAEKMVPTKEVERQILLLCPQCDAQLEVKDNG